MGREEVRRHGGDGQEFLKGLDGGSGNTPLLPPPLAVSAKSCSAHLTPVVDSYSWQNNFTLVFNVIMTSSTSVNAH